MIMHSPGSTLALPLPYDKYYCLVSSEVDVSRASGTQRSGFGWFFGVSV